MTRKSWLACAAATALALALLVSPLAAQTGTIKGKVVDDKGRPLHGAYLYVTSPSVLGVSTAFVSSKGRYGVPGLPPGSYRLIVEMPGYKTVVIDGVKLNPGASATVNVRMEPSQSEEEMTEQRPGPGLDRQSARSATVLDSELISRLPLPREFEAILGLLPGSVFEGEVPDTRLSFSAVPPASTTLIADEVILTSPVDQRSLGRIDVALIDQVVVETAGRPAASGDGQGAAVYVVSPPGTERLKGGLSYTNASKGLSRSLWSDEEASEMTGGSVPSALREHDLSLTLGAPVFEEMAWLFAGLRVRSQSRRAPFRYWTDPLGVRHFVYDFSEQEGSGLIKLTASVLDRFKGGLEFSLSELRQPVLEADIDRLRPEEATRSLDGDKDILGRAYFTYVIDPNTVVDLSVGTTRSKTALLLNPSSTNKPEYEDRVTGYRWGSGDLNERESTSRTKASAVLTHLADRLLGLPHELVAGGEYESQASLTSVWKTNNLLYNYSNGSPYTFGRTLSPVSGNEVGWGLVGFWIAPAQQGALQARRELKRLGFFVQDTVRIGGRLSLSAGLRFDRSEVRFPSLSKGTSGNSVAVSVGSGLIQPILGYNLYGSFTLGSWEKAIIWNSLSPRVGLSFDVFGTGRTVLKGSFARIPDVLGLGYSQDLTQADPHASHDFIWYDEDGDGVVTATDLYVLMPYDFRVYKNEFNNKAVDPDLKAPVLEEWSAGLEQEIGRDVSLAARYISRRHTNVIGHVLYDPSTEVHWWRTDDSPEGWWVPFTTVVPGAGGSPDVPVSLLLPSTTAPAFFERIENVPDLKARYRSFELSFRKRMSRNWQLYGAVSWNKATGSTNVASRWSAGHSPVILTPNAFTNIAETDRLPQDRPFVARLAGTVRFRGDVFLSFLLKAQSGAPWSRTVTIIPPADWAAAHGAQAIPVSVYLESPNSRRHDGWTTLDLRLEKEFFRARRVRYTASLDVFNVLGEKYRIPDLNDGGTWAPTGAGTNEGVRLFSSTYGTYRPIWGQRSVRFSLGLKF